jgi:hypothetical protein
MPADIVRRILRSPFGGIYNIESGDRDLWKKTSEQ